MALIDKETIRAEIERIVKEILYSDSSRYDASNENSWRNAVEDIMNVLDTLPEQPVLPGIDEKGIPGKDFIPVEWVDACERYGKWKIVQKVKSAGEDLDAEVDRFYRSDEYKMSHVLGRGFEAIAYHFFDLGCRRTAEMYDDIEYERQRAEEAEITKGLEEEIEIEAERFVKTLPWRTNTPPMPDEYIDWSTFKTIARHFAEWGAEHLKR